MYEAGTAGGIDAASGIGVTMNVWLLTVWPSGPSRRPSHRRCPPLIDVRTFDQHVPAPGRPARVVSPVRAVAPVDLRVVVAHRIVGPAVVASENGGERVQREADTRERIDQGRSNDAQRDGAERRAPLNVAARPAAATRRRASARQPRWSPGPGRSNPPGRSLRWSTAYELFAVW